MRRKASRTASSRSSSIQRVWSIGSKCSNQHRDCKHWLPTPLLHTAIINLCFLSKRTRILEIKWASFSPAMSGWEGSWSLWTTSPPMWPTGTVLLHRGTTRMCWSFPLLQWQPPLMKSTSSIPSCLNWTVLSRAMSLMWAEALWKYKLLSNSKSRALRDSHVQPNLSWLLGTNWQIKLTQSLHYSSPRMIILP